MKTFSSRPRGAALATCVLLGLGLSSTGAQAATFTVTTAADSGAGSLRAAIAAANDETTNAGADIITFAPTLAGQTIGLSTVDARSIANTPTGTPANQIVAFGQTALLVTSQITIQGPTTSPGIVIARGAGAPNMRLFGVSGTGNLSIRNLWLTGGLARGGNGGGGNVAGGGGAAGLGGAVFNAGTLSISGSTLSGSQAIGGSSGPVVFGAGAGGGGLAANGGSGNASAGGGPNGGIGGANGTPGGFGGGGGGSLLNNSTGGGGGFGGGGGGAFGNNSTGGGGGFGGGGGGTNGNNSTGGAGGFGGGGGTSSGTGYGGGGAGLGGAIFNYGGMVTLANSTFSGNTAQGGAGGTASNPGQGLGGALFSRNGTANIDSCTFNVNTSAQGGGGVYLLGDGATASLNLFNSILANTYSGASDFAVNTINGGTQTVNGGTQTLISARNLIETSTFPQVGAVSTDPLLSLLQDNGGPTPTHALLQGSPAIDAGSTTLGTDQRGFVRPYDNPASGNSGGNLSDIGAVEQGSTEIRQSGPNLVVNKTDDHDDGVCGVTDCTLREAIGAANTTAGDQVIGFDATVFAGAKTITLTGGELLVTGNGKITIGSPTTGKLTLSGNNVSRVFGLAFNVGANLSLSGLTLTAGVGNQIGSSGGGAIYSNGTLVVNNCTFVGNGNNLSGGAINNNGTAILTVNNSTFVNNIGSNGGAIFIIGGATSISTATINNCTFTGNRASNGGGAIGGAGTFGVTVSNSIMVGNTALNGPDVSNVDTSGRFNIVGGTAVQAGLQTDGNGAPVLADNGGPTQTVALVVGSPAINAGSTVLTTDQRGVARDARPDIGAFEFPNSAPLISSVSITPTNPKTNDTLTAAATATDAEGDTLTYSYVWKKGQTTVQSGGSNTLDLSTAGNGDRGDSITVTVTANDGIVNSTPVTSAPVIVQNSNPTANNDSAPLAEDSGTTVINVLGNDSSAPDSGETLSVTAVTQPAAGTGTVSLSAGVVRFTPSANFNGTTSFTYTLSDGNGGTATGTVTVTVTPVNDAPVVSSVTLTPATPRTNDLLTATVVASDVENDGLTYTYVWKKNGTVVSGESNSTLDLSKTGNGDNGDSITATVTANDGTLDSAPMTSNAVTIGNSVPTITSVALAPTSPSTNSTLTATVVASDVDGDGLTYIYEWKKNGVILSGETNSTLDLSKAGNGDKGDSITVSVSVNDGTAQSAVVTSNTVTVANSAPLITSVTLMPNQPLTTSLLTATVVASDADGDGDGLTYIYEWKKNGVILSGETGSTLDLSKAGNGDDGDSLTVTVTANDGGANSAPVTSGAVVVGNRTPKVESVTPQGASDPVGAKRLFTITVSDANGTSDIKDLWLLINTRLNWSEGAIFMYVPSTTSPTSGQLFLRKGDTTLPPITIENGVGLASQSLDNGAVRIFGNEVQVSSSGNAITLSVNALIRDGLFGNNTLFARVEDRQSAVDAASLAGEQGYVRFGPYTVTSQFPSSQNSVPTLSKLTPGASYTTLTAAGVAPKAQPFGFFAKDEDGLSDIESVIFLAGKQRGWKNSATFLFTPRTRRLYLRSDDGSVFLGGGQIGQAGILENSQVRVDLAQVKFLVYPDGKSMGLSLPLQAKNGLLGQNRIWLRVQDNQGAVAEGSDDQGYVLSGTWEVKAPAPPRSTTNPSAGNS